MIFSMGRSCMGGWCRGGKIYCCCCCCCWWGDGKGWDKKKFRLKKNLSSRNNAVGVREVLLPTATSRATCKADTPHTTLWESEFVTRMRTASFA
jgi:hypothetical protein